MYIPKPQKTTKKTADPDNKHSASIIERSL